MRWSGQVRPKGAFRLLSPAPASSLLAETPDLNDDRVIETGSVLFTEGGEPAGITRIKSELQNASQQRRVQRLLVTNGA